jgi:hypothetical protein
VVEAHIEAGQAGEFFERRICRLDARVAVHTERAARGRELLDMTVCASLVAGQTRANRVVRTLMAGVASKRRVLRNRV